MSEIVERNTDALAELDAELDEDPGFNPIPVRMKINHQSALLEIPGLPGQDAMEAVVLAASRVRVFFPRMGVEVTTNEILQFCDNRPFCHSFDYVNGNLIEADWDNAPESADMLRKKIAEGALACTMCPLDKWESVGLLGRTGRGKACAELRRLLLWRQGWDVPVILSVPTSSIRAWDGYCSSLSVTSKKLYHVVTKISLEAKSGAGKNWAVAKFTMKDVITEEMRQQLIERVNLRGIEQSRAKALVDVFKRRELAEEDYPTNGDSAPKADADDLGEDF